MEITQEQRTALLEEIKLSIGLLDRDDDEFTSQEIEDCWNISNTLQYFKDNEIKYERRKALANGRRQFVYRFIKETE